MDVGKTCSFNIMEHDAMDVADVFRTIFSSCDVDNTGLVPVTNLIEFIKPYLLEDLNALADLRHALDPRGVNALVSREIFYEVMNQWSQKLGTASSGEDTEFDRSPNMLTPIDDKDLPYTHSTPRASLGEKLLRCKDLLNLSNVSGYSLSTSRLEHVVEPDKTVLEEEIKKLEHQLLKTTNELDMVKQQLTVSEDQNDQLQQDLDRVNRRLNAEQQVNEHLQKDIKYSEELRDELNNYKKTVEELKKKLLQFEKDNLYHKNMVNETEQEKMKLEKKLETLSKQHQDCLKELFDIKTELEAKDEQISETSKFYSELKSKFSEQKDFIDQLREENDLLNHQKLTLEKVMKAKPSNSPHSNLGKLILNLSKTPPPSSSTFNTSSPYQSNSQLHQPKQQSSPLLRKVLSKDISSTPVTEEKSLLDASPPYNFRNVPVLSPVRTVSFGDHNKKQDSSEEDLYWKMQQGDVRSNGQDMNGTTESLQTEMYKADPFKINDSHQTTIFEKEERIAELEVEIETLNSYIGRIEYQNNEFLSKLREQEKRNVELLENNVLPACKEESAHKIESLTQRIAQLERNGQVVENQQEVSHSDTEDMRHGIQILEIALQEKEAALKTAMETISSLQIDAAELQEKLSDYDKQLQVTMKDLNEMTIEKKSLQENVDSLQMKLSAAEEKLTELESIISNLSQENKELEEENFIVKHDIECSRSKCENLALRISTMDKEFRTEKQKSEEFAQHKAKLEIEVKEFKENLEKKLVAEFEAKVKYSMVAEEKIMQLNQKCNSQEDELATLREELGNKNRMLCDAKNRITLLVNEKERLQKEMDCLNAAKTELEIEITQLKTERAETSAKFGNLNLVAADIQNHIVSKNNVIEELKKLNRSLETNLNRAQFEVRKKVDDILEMRNELTKELDIKNDLWKKARSLEKELHTKTIEINQLTERYQTLLNSNNELNIEYNNLLIVYDLEVNKNGKLVKHVAQSNEEKDNCYRKYNELETELKNISEKNQNLSKLVSDYELQISDLETCNKELRKRIPVVDTQDSTSQTIRNDILDAEEAFSKIKKESDQLLEELEMKLNAESKKNRSLTAHLLEMRNNYAQNNAELDQMKQKLADNEAEMAKKLQESHEKCNSLVEDLKDSEEKLNMKIDELSEIKNELKETQNSLMMEYQKNMNTAEGFEHVIEEYNEVLGKLKKAKADLLIKDNEKSKIEIELSHTKELLEVANEKNRVLVEGKRKFQKEMTEEHEKLSKANDTIDKNNNEIKKLSSELTQITEELKKETERNRILSLQLEDKSNSLQDTCQQLNANQEYFEKVNRELFEDIEKLHAQLTEKDTEIINLKNTHKLLKDTIQQENNQLMLDLQQELTAAKDEKQKLSHKLSEVNNELVRLEKECEKIKNINKELQKDNDELAAKANLTKQEKDNLNKELLLLKQDLTETKKEKITLFTATNQRIQEELAKNKALFENFSTLKKESAKLIFDLKETQALLANSEISCSKKQKELLDLQTKHSLMETKFTDQAKELEKLELLLDKTRSEMTAIIQERDELKCQLTNIQILLNESKGAEREKSDIKGKTYSRQQITIDKLKDKIEDLENKLSAEKDKNHQLNNRLILIEDKVVGNDEAKEELEKLIKQIADKEERRNEISCEIATLEEKLGAIRDELETLDWHLENEKHAELNSTEDIGIQVDASEIFNYKCEGRSIGKFTLASRSESPDSPSTGIDSIGLTNLRGSCIVKSPYTVYSDFSNEEIPSLDVSGLADDIIEELELGDSSPRKKLDREELEKKVTALTLRLVANDNSISERIEQQTEKYRCQYLAILTLVGDISHRLRDHVCIGTAEPIVPVYVLLEEIKIRMKELVQNAGQVGVLICENRMKRCWNLTVNYMAMLRQDNEVLHNISRDTTPTQTGQIGTRNQYTQEKAGPPKDKRQRRKLIARCTKFCGSVLFVIALSLAVSLAINLTCATENQYCPLDYIVQQITVGQPPM